MKAIERIDKINEATEELYHLCDNLMHDLEYVLTDNELSASPTYKMCGNTKEALEKVMMEIFKTKKTIGE